MFGLQMLDVVIGMVFIYLLLSLVCSAISELIETALKYRAKFLKQSLLEILGDENSVKLFYTHPLINGLFRDPYDPSKTGNLPSYISSHDFALALMDIVSPQSGTADSAQHSLEALRQTIGKLQNSTVKGILTPLVNAAGNNINNVQKNIEAWFDNAMERTTGWYKKHTQWILLVTALLVTAIVNADTLKIANYLWSDDAKREAIGAMAQAYAKPSVPQDLNSPKDANTPKDANGMNDSNNMALYNKLSDIQKVGLPIGWSNWSAPPRLSGYWDLIFGWIITTIALSMGASFWFDCLKNLINIRSSLKPAAKTP